MLERPQIEIPTAAQILHLQPGRISRSGLGAMMREQARRIEAGEDPLIAGAASYSNYAEQKILEHSVGKNAWTMPTVYLALCTAVPTDASTGATIEEATGATGYKRLKVEGALWTYSAPAIKNNATLTFPEITAGSATVKGWALVDSETTGAGNAIAWGTLTETSISTTATPPTVNKEILIVELD